MICALLFHAGDVEAAIDLLQWMQQLGGCKVHGCLLVADRATPFDKCRQATRIAGQVFKQVRCISNHGPVNGWPEGPNSLFRAAAEFVGNHWPEPWLLLETDAVPLRKGWLDALSVAYQGVNTVMGDHYHGLDSVSGLPVQAFSGVAVYPAKVIEHLKAVAGVPWDMANREWLLSNAVATPLIKHLYGQKDLPPTFVERRDSSALKNAFTVEDIRPEAVLFHRCKDGSLIRVLRKRLGIRENIGLMVALPVCQKDAHLLRRNLEWMIKLDGQQPASAVLVLDEMLPQAARSDLNRLLKLAFDDAQEWVFPKPKSMSWPQAPNAMFQAVAYRVLSTGKPWLWCEPDAWPLRSGWLLALDSEYRRRGKPVFGPVVPVMGHVNGVAIYPANFSAISPRAMSATNQAWDSVCRPDLDGKIADGSALMQHAWGMSPIGFTPYGGSGSPTFGNAKALKWLKPGAVLFHRCKDFTLVNLLNSKP